MSALIAVTGARGLLGRAVISTLRSRGVRTRGIVRPGSGEPPPESGCDVVAADVRDRPALIMALRGCDAVIHAASKMEGPDHELASTNLGGTRAVIEAAVACGVGTLVYVSSAAVYGGGDLVDVAETRPRRPQCVYSITKARAEDEVTAAACDGRFGAWILRPCTLYGPGDPHFSRYVLELAAGGVIPLVRGGAVRFDLLAASDLAEVCARASETVGPDPATVLNVASGENLTIVELVERVRARLGLPVRTVDVPDALRPPPEVPASLVFALSEHRVFSTERARTLLGFTSRARFPDGLAAARSPASSSDRSPTHVARD